MTRNGLIFTGLLLAAILIATAAGTTRRPAAQPTATTSPPATPDERSEDPPEPSATPVRIDAASSNDPRAAVRAFALQTTNWNWRNLKQQGVRAERLASPRLATTIARQLQVSLTDTTLTRDRAGNQGQVIAIDIQGTGPRRHSYVITRETTTANGTQPAGPATYKTYAADLIHAQSRWTIDTWQPLS